MFELSEDGLRLAAKYGRPGEGDRLLGQVPLSTLRKRNCGRCWGEVMMAL
jgi:hypothetical protein